MPEFEELYQTYYPQVYKYILKLCKDEALAEEITQETFFKVLKKAAGFRGQCRFSVWVCQIAKNTYFTHLKKNKHMTGIRVETLTLENGDDPEKTVIDRDTALKIYEILRGMEQPYRDVFWMRTFGELSFREIAGVHEKSESWARVTYHRAKMRIREELE